MDPLNQTYLIIYVLLHDSLMKNALLVGLYLTQSLQPSKSPAILIS